MDRTIQDEERKLVLKVIQFFENEKKRGSFIVPVEQATKRACLATGLSKSTIMEMKSEAKEMHKLAETATKTVAQKNLSAEENYQQTQLSDSAPYDLDIIKLHTPGKTRKKYKTKVDLSDSNLCAIRSLVENFYTTRKEKPSLKKILKIAKEELNFPGQKDALRNILVNSLGYNFNKHERTCDIQSEKLVENNKNLKICQLSKILKKNLMHRQTQSDYSI